MSWGAATLGPSSVFAILAYHCMPLLPLDLRVLRSLVYLIIPSQAQASVNGEWTDVCLTYQLRITLIPFGWIKSSERLGCLLQSTQESYLSIFKSSSVCVALHM